MRAILIAVMLSTVLASTGMTAEEVGTIFKSEKVVVRNPDSIIWRPMNMDLMLRYGDSCDIHSGGRYKVLGDLPSSQMVALLYTAPKITSSHACPTGTVFFVGLGWLIKNNEEKRDIDRVREFLGKN